MAISDDNTRIAAIISKADKEQLEAIAETEGRTLSRLMARIIGQYLKDKAGS